MADMKGCQVKDPAARDRRLQRLVTSYVRTMAQQRWRQQRTDGCGVLAGVVTEARSATSLMLDRVARHLRQPCRLHREQRGRSQSSHVGLRQRGFCGAGAVMATEVQQQWCGCSGVAACVRRHLPHWADTGHKGYMGSELMNKADEGHGGRGREARLRGQRRALSSAVRRPAVWPRRCPCATLAALSASSLALAAFTSRSRVAAACALQPQREPFSLYSRSCSSDQPL